MRRKIPVAGKKKKPIRKICMYREVQTVSNQRIRHGKCVRFCTMSELTFVPAVHSGNWLPKKETGFATRCSRFRSRDMGKHESSIPVHWLDSRFRGVDKTGMARVLRINPKEKSDQVANIVWCITVFLSKHFKSLRFYNKMGESVVEIVTNFITCKY